MEIDNDNCEDGSQDIEMKKKLSLSDIPWDCVNIIFDFTPTTNYK